MDPAHLSPCFDFDLVEEVYSFSFFAVCCTVALVYTDEFSSFGFPASVIDRGDEIREIGLKCIQHRLDGVSTLVTWYLDRDSPSPLAVSI